VGASSGHRAEVRKEVGMAMSLCTQHVQPVPCWTQATNRRPSVTQRLTACMCVGTWWSVVALAIIRIALLTHQPARAVRDNSQTTRSRSGFDSQSLNRGGAKTCS
jgi:hypothetical protein